MGPELSGVKRGIGDRFGDLSGHGYVFCRINSYACGVVKPLTTVYALSTSQEMPNVLAQELRAADAELEQARRAGRELRFPKEKKDILMMACAQLSGVDAV